MPRDAGEPRVAFVASGLGLGGAEAMLLKIVPRLAAEGFGVAVVSLRDLGPVGRRLRDLRIDVQACGLPGLSALPSTARAAGWLRAFRPDVLQGWMYHGNLGALAAARATPSRPAVAFGIRQSLPSIDDEKPGTRIAIRAGARCSRRAAAIVYNARLSLAQHEAAGYAHGAGLVIANGFDTATFRPDAQVARATRADLQVAADAPLVGLVARWHPVKDHRTFVDAAARIARAMPAARFVMAGTGIDSGNEALATLLARSGIADRVRLVGERRDVDRLYPALDVACLASRAEAFPNVLGEALSCGVPCVSTAVGDAAEIIGECGRIVPPGDADALAAAVLQVLAMPAHERDAMGTAARERVVAQFGIDAVVRQYADLYRSLRRSRPPVPSRSP